MIFKREQKMKSIIQSYTSQEIDRILVGKQTVKICKTAPKDTPFKVYMYMIACKERFPLWEYVTSYRNSKGQFIDGSQKVVGEYVCENVEIYRFSNYEAEYNITHDQIVRTFLNQSELIAYGKGKDLRALNISVVKIYDEPRELGEFYRRLSDKVLEAGDYDCRKSDNVICSDFWDGGSDNCSDCPFGGKVYLSRPPRGWQYVQPFEE